MPSRTSLWAPVGLYMALIFGLSSLEHPPDLPSAISDKAGHALLYSGLGALSARALARGWRRVSLASALGAIVLSALYGVTDELHQLFVPPRLPEALDLLADTIGAAVGAGALRSSARLAAAKRKAWGIIRGRHGL